jgi:hypothetical protein
VIDDDKREVNVVKFLLRFKLSVKLSIYNYLTDAGVNTTQWTSGSPKSGLTALPPQIPNEQLHRSCLRV